MYGMFMPTKGFYDAPVVVAAVATEQFNAFEAMGCDMDEFCVETLDQATDHSDASLCDLIGDIAGQLGVLARRFLSGALQRTAACGVRGEGKRFVAYGTPPPQDIRWRRGRPTWGWWSCRKDGVVRRRRPSFMNAMSHTVWRALRANIALLVVAFRFTLLPSFTRYFASQTPRVAMLARVCGSTTTVRTRVLSMLKEMKVVLDERPRLNLEAGRSIAQRQEVMEAALAVRSIIPIKGPFQSSSSL